MSGTKASLLHWTPCLTGNTGTYFFKSPILLPLSLSLNGDFLDCFRDQSIPPLDSLSNEKEREDLEKMKGFIETAVTFEDRVSLKASTASETQPYPDPSTECKPPESVARPPSLL